MSNWETGGWVKIERAKEHVGNLESEISAFHQRSPYSVVGEDDPNTGDWVVRARIRETPPLRWGAIAGDAIHNLRASLDVLWRCVMYPSGGGAGNRKIQFPIFDSADKCEAHHSREIEGPRKGAVDILKALKPYSGGNEPLWLLHVLDIIDKHRGLIPAYSTVGTTIIDLSVGLRHVVRDDPEWGEIPSMRIGLNWAEPACPVEDGAELWRVRAAQRSQVDMNPQFPFTIAFGEAEIVKGKAIIPTLHQSVQTVEGVAGVFATAGLLRG